MKIVFFGTPEFVIPVLSALYKKYNRGRFRELIAVITPEAKPSGREKRLTRTAVDNWAYRHKIPVIFDLAHVPEAELAVVAAYGKIIPQAIIDRFSSGIINLHPSDLPAFRGASPVQATILSGMIKGTMTAIKMDAGMDHGDIISKFSLNIGEHETAGELRDRLFNETPEFLIELIPAFIAGKVKPKPQDHDNATFTKQIEKQDGFIDGKVIKSAMAGNTSKSRLKINWMPDFELSVTPHNIDRFIRALSPWPKVYTLVNDKRLIIHSAHVESEKLVLDEVQLEGKTLVTWKEFERGYPSITFG